VPRGCGAGRASGARVLRLASAAGLVVAALLWRASPAAFAPTVHGLCRRPLAAGRGWGAGCASATTRRAAATAFEVKEGVKAQIFFEHQWWDGEILEVSADGLTCTARYYDGGDEEPDIDVESRIREMPPPMPLKKGQKVELEFEGSWYESEIVEVSKDGFTCTAKYDEGGDVEPDIDVYSRIRPPRLQLEDLSIGQKLRATVVSIAPFGAFVDFGGEREGLVHISCISTERVEVIEDYVQEGQQVDVWIKDIKEDGKIAMTMVEGKLGGGGGGRRERADISLFQGVAPSEWLTGTVVQTVNFGIFVSVTPPGSSTPADGLVHITQIRDGYVDSTEEEVEIGQEVKVRVVGVDVQAGRLSLSMKEDGGGGGGGRGRRAPVDMTPFADFPPDEWLKGTVQRIAPFGFFVSVTLPDGATADGLVHITRIREGFVENIEDEAEVGQEIDVRIESVDIDAGKMSLSMLDDGPRY